MSYQFVLRFCQKVRLDVLINFVLIKKMSVFKRGKGNVKINKGKWN